MNHLQVPASPSFIHPADGTGSLFTGSTQEPLCSSEQQPPPSSGSPVGGDTMQTSRQCPRGQSAVTESKAGGGDRVHAGDTGNSRGKCPEAGHASQEDGP